MSLTNPNTPVSQQDLQDFYHKLLPYMGGSFEAIANKFSKGDMYSTDEKMIGQWTDGKPLYQKSFYATNIEITAGLIAIGDLTGLSIDKGYVSKVFGMDSDYSYNESRIDAWLRLPNNNIGLKAVSGASNMNLSYVAVTIQYTKTTDSAISIGDDTDYSTEEKIVGTWIDGSLVYQKTIDCGALPNNTEKSVAHNIANVDIVISCRGIAYKNDKSSMLQLPYVHPSSEVSISGNSTVIWIGTVTDRSSYTSTYVTLQYTKTTD